MRGHRYVPTLVDPGEQDLTSHVDFEALGRAAADAGAKVTGVVTQGDWLNRLGIGARAAALATANPDRVPELEDAVDRLCHEDRMGQLFKVMAHPRSRLARSSRVGLMAISYRRAMVDDAAAIDGVFRKSFCDTFEHLYRPQDLAAFLGEFTLNAWEAELEDDRFAFQVAEAEGQVVGYVKLGPPSLPVETGRRIR